MTARHHPGEDVLVGYASGALAEPLALVVATHLALCPACRGTVDRLEAIGGVLLDRLAVEAGNAASDASAIDAAIARATRLSAAPAPRGATTTSDRLFPQPLFDYAGGDVDRVVWKTLAPGIRHAVVARNAAGATARLLWVAPGRSILEHTHRGTEMTLVLQGSYTAGGQRYLRGDLEQADDTDIDHHPIAGTEATCICLVGNEAPLKFNGTLGRLLQPFWMV